MEKGDISNEVPRRVLITYEALTTEETTPKKFLGVTTGSKTTRRFDRSVLSLLWRYTDRVPVMVEMVNYGVDDEEATARLDKLDAMGTNPVNYSLAIADIDSLLAELPYRPEVLGVVDIPENQARYGLRGMGLDHLGRIF